MEKLLQWFTKYQRFIQMAIGVFSIGLVIWIVYINRDELRLLLNFQLWHLATMIFVYILQFFVSALSLWLIISRLGGKSVSTIDWIKIMLVSRMANYLMPKSGGIYKAFVLKKNYKIHYTKFIHIYAFFSWLTILINLGLVALLILISMPDLEINNYLVFPIVAGLFLSIMFGPLLVNRVFNFYHPRSIFLSNLTEKIHEIFITMLNHGRDMNFMSKLIGTQILKFGLYVLLFKLLFAGLGVGIDSNYAKMALFIAVEQMNVIFYITPGNIGITELLYGAISSAIGVGVAEGVIAAALLRAIGYLVIFPFGIAFGGLKVYRSIKLQIGLEENA